ncbi:hypothetical protein [Streptomyces sp. NBC_01450]|uniref:hypothetical protein n=1 Tax=Streptomyces sp. NBC_01450 TaxID=2903871 RepID=UPI003FCE832B
MTSRDDLAHVLVEVADRHGRLVPDAALGVTFQVDGADELATVGNGNPHNVNGFGRPRRDTWHGQALAILRPAKSPGRVTLTASAPGLRPAAMTLTVGQERTMDPCGRRSAGDKPVPRLIRSSRRQKTSPFRSTGRGSAERRAGLAPAFPRRKRGVFPWTTNARLAAVRSGGKLTVNHSSSHGRGVEGFPPFVVSPPCPRIPRNCP